MIHAVATREGGLIHLCNGGPKGRLTILYRLLAALALLGALISLAPQLGQLG